MDWFSPERMVAIGALLTILGGAIRWTVDRADRKGAARDAATNERIARLEARIVELEKLERLFWRHINALEATLAANGLTPPATPGWPP